MLAPLSRAKDYLFIVGHIDTMNEDRLWKKVLYDYNYYSINVPRKFSYLREMSSEYRATRLSHLKNKCPLKISKRKRGR